MSRNCVTAFLAKAILIAYILIALLSAATSVQALPASEDGLRLCLQWPVRGEVICKFREASGLYGSGGHAGIDIAVPLMTEVRAAESGYVSFSGRTPVGNCVSIKHGERFKTTYVGLSAALISSGSYVESGTPIGLSDGSADKSTQTPHLHFGLFIDGIAVDPLLFLGKEFDLEGICYLAPCESSFSISSYEREISEWGSTEANSGLEISSDISTKDRIKDFVFGAGRSAGRFIGGAGSAACRIISGVWSEASEKVESVLNNRYFQAFLIGLAAALIVITGVVCAVLVLGISIPTAVVASIAALAGSLGYALYYAFTSGDSFSAQHCFFGALIFGGMSATLSLSSSFLSAYFASGLELLGKGAFVVHFLVNGTVDTLFYYTLCWYDGLDSNPITAIVIFVTGGIIGCIGEFLLKGMFGKIRVIAGSSESLSAIEAAGAASNSFIVEISSMGSSIARYTYRWSATSGRRMIYMFMNGSLAVVSDFIVSAAMGREVSVEEMVTVFFVGVTLSGFKMATKGEGFSLIKYMITGVESKESGFIVKALKKVVLKYSKEISKRIYRRREDLWKRAKENILSENQELTEFNGRFVSGS